MTEDTSEPTTTLLTEPAARPAESAAEPAVSEPAASAAEHAAPATVPVDEADLTS